MLDGCEQRCLGLLKSTPSRNDGRRPAFGEKLIERQAEASLPTVSRDGRRVVLRDQGGVRLWDIDKGAQTGPFLPLGGSAFHADFSPDNQRLAVASDDGLARIWDLTVGKLEKGRHGDASLASKPGTE